MRSSCGSRSSGSCSFERSGRDRICGPGASCWRRLPCPPRSSSSGCSRSSPTPSRSLPTGTRSSARSSSTRGSSTSARRRATASLPRYSREAGRSRSRRSCSFRWPRSPRAAAGPRSSSGGRSRYSRSCSSRCSSRSSRISSRSRRHGARRASSRLRSPSPVVSPSFPACCGPGCRRLRSSLAQSCSTSTPVTSTTPSTIPAPRGWCGSRWSAARLRSSSASFVEVGLRSRTRRDSLLRSSCSPSSRSAWPSGARSRHRPCPSSRRGSSKPCGRRCRSEQSCTRIRRRAIGSPRPRPSTSRSRRPAMLPTRS